MPRIGSRCFHPSWLMTASAEESEDVLASMGQGNGSDWISQRAWRMIRASGVSFVAEVATPSQKRERRVDLGLGRGEDVQCEGTSCSRAAEGRTPAYTDA